MKDTKKLNLNELDQANGGMTDHYDYELIRQQLRNALQEAPLMQIPDDVVPTTIPQEIIDMLDRSRTIGDPRIRRRYPTEIVSIDLREDYGRGHGY